MTLTLDRVKYKKLLFTNALKCQKIGITALSRVFLEVTELHKTLIYQGDKDIIS